MFDRFQNKSFSFGTKAETLGQLRGKLEHSKIPEFDSVTSQEWAKDRNAALDRFQKRFGGLNVAVRSSAKSEDTSDESMAGRFLSMLNVPVDESDEFANAIDSVFKSYDEVGSVLSEEDSVLVQKLQTDVLLSGVIMTQDLQSGAPYYVVNYDDSSGQTETVTSGALVPRSLYIHRSSIEMVQSRRWQRVLAAVREIEQVTDCSYLDIEFAIDQNLDIQLFQVRRISLQPNWNRDLTLRINDTLKRIENFVSKKLRPVEGIYGDQSVFAQMSDWNPAEIIGTAPRPLAASLYRKLVTDRSWRVARKQMGYSEPIGSGLMVLLGGQPFIDVRLSFHSFLPATLDESIGDRLASAWLKRLRDFPELHDKVEFDIALTALTFDFKEKFEEQCGDAGLTASERDEFQTSLHRLTADLLEQRTAPISEQLARIENLETFRDMIASNAEQPDIRFVRALAEACIEDGTIPFAILARHAFVAVSLLKSLVARGIFTESDLGQFFDNIETITTELLTDISETRSGKMEPERFLERYGHLRPGTYEIMSERYDMRSGFIENLRATKSGRESLKPNQEFRITKIQADAVSALLREYNFDITSEQFFDYIAQSIRAREYSKFMFSRCISDMLEFIAHWGTDIGLSRTELSYLPIDVIVDSDVETPGRDIEERLRELSRRGKRDHEITQALRLPLVLHEASDIHVVPVRISRPNFVTSKSVEAPVLVITSSTEPSELRGKIVVLESADPGYDWMFAFEPVGLITKFGGVNSHMSIRCAELGIPAAIGCGPQLYDLACNAAHMLLDCESGRIMPTAREH